MDWKSYQKEIRQALIQDGTYGHIRKKVVGDYNITTGKKTTINLDYEVYILFRSSSNINEQINRDEISIICSFNKEIDMLNVKNLFVVYDDIEYEIIKSEAVRPGGEILLYKLTCRS